MTKKHGGLNLADLAPMTEEVPVGDSFLSVRGISVKSALDIFKRFPKLVGMLGGSFDLGSFIAVAPDAVAAIIASASGSPNDETAEEAAASLSIETQLDILEAVGRLTFTKGFAPFAERVMALVGGNSGNPSKVPDMKSPPASKDLSPPDTPQA
jgi:hypothetical protein